METWPASSGDPYREIRSRAGGIAVKTIGDDIGGLAGSGIAFESRGTHTLKGVPDAWEIMAGSA
jgi:hypothetical protein